MAEMKSNDVYLDSDGTLGISADVDISKVKRILLTQEGTHCGSMYSQNLPDTNVGDTIYRQSAIDIVRDRVKRYTTACVLAVTELQQLPSAQPEIAENLYLYKCYITDKDGLQHEVIHTGDIRRVTGWEI